MFWNSALIINKTILKMTLTFWPLDRITIEDDGDAAAKSSKNCSSMNRTLPVKVMSRTCRPRCLAVRRMDRSLKVIGQFIVFFRRKLALAW